MSVARTLAAGLVACVAWLGAPSVAQAADDERGRPWAQGTIAPNFGFGFGYSQDLVSLSFGLGAGYYIASGFSVGLQVEDEILIYSKPLKNELPDLENQIPTNVFSLRPTAQWVFLRRPRFSPYVFAGLGPVFFNNDSGVHGQWTAGPGAYIGVGGPVWIDLGVGFTGMFPTGQCNERFEYQPSAAGAEPIPVIDYCSFRWGPRLGLVLALGGSRRQRSERAKPADPFLPPAEAACEPAARSEFD